MTTHDQSWEDFTHTTLTPQATADEILERYREFHGFIAKISRKELVARHWLKSEDDTSSLAAIFFDLPLSKQPTLFRKSENANDNLLAIWQARARAQAEYFLFSQEIRTPNELTKHRLHDLARKSVDPQIVRQLPQILSKLGVILVYVQALPCMKADGAVFRLESGHPVVAMSLRYPRLDYFWFTLLHELAHLVLHSGKLDDSVFFDSEAAERDVAEAAANRLAKDSLVSRESWRSCDPKFDSSERAVHKYAAKEGIHPAIVAGLLRRESGDYTRYNDIVNQYDVRSIIFEQ